MKDRSIKRQARRKAYLSDRNCKRELGDHRRTMARAFWGRPIDVRSIMTVNGATVLDGCGVEVAGGWELFDRAVAESNREMQKLILRQELTR